jgi:hypothetical protein
MSDDEYEVTNPDGQKITTSELFKAQEKKATTDLEDHYKEPVEIKTGVKIGQTQNASAGEKLSQKQSEE